MVSSSSSAKLDNPSFSTASSLKEREEYGERNIIPDFIVDEIRFGKSASSEDMLEIAETDSCVDFLRGTLV